MIQKILEIITRNSEAFSLIASFFAWVVGMFTNKGWEKIKKARRISALRLRKDRTCKIVMPTYNNIDLYPQSRSRTMFDVNSQGDVLASLNVVSFAGYVGLEFANEYYVLGEHPNEIVANNNIFCIGGIVANKQKGIRAVVCSDTYSAKMLQINKQEHIFQDFFLNLEFLIQT